MQASVRLSGSHLKLGPLYASNAPWGIPPSQLGTVDELGLCKVVRASLTQLTAHLIPAKAVLLTLVSVEMKWTGECGVLINVFFRVFDFSQTAIRVRKGRRKEGFYEKGMAKLREGRGG